MRDAHPVQRTLVQANCTANGCLFQVADDTNEYTDLAESLPDVVQSLNDTLTAMSAGFYSNDDDIPDSCPALPDDDPDADVPCACRMAFHAYGGFFGPYQQVEW